MGEPVPPTPPPSQAPGEYAPNADERSLAMWAHLGTALVNWVLGGNGWLVALIIYLIKKDASRFVAFHALQALFLQIGVWAACMVCVVTGIFCCFPFFLIIPVLLGAMIYGVILAIKANQGLWTEYWLVGHPAKNIVLKPAPPPPPAPATPA